MRKPGYWFPAKRYGWGWGLPVAWQGWIVLIAFLALLAAGAAVLLPRVGECAFLAYSGLLCAVLIGICYLKGEPPEWRWGRSR